MSASSSTRKGHLMEGQTKKEPPSCRLQETKREVRQRGMKTVGRRRTAISRKNERGSLCATKMTVSR